MGKRHFYLLCALPGLKTFGSVPPVRKQELLSLVIESSGPIEIVQTMLLSDDLLQREAVLAGETRPDHAEPAVLSLQQVKDEEPLPDFLIPEQEEESGSEDNPVAADRIWRRYFQYASGVARIRRTPFLQAWVGFEVGLRNALAKARAEALELDPGPYMVAPELGNPEFPFNNLLNDWSAASNPFEGFYILDRARWNWVTEHEDWYSFSDDELAAYTAKLMILHRWQRISGGGTESRPSDTVTKKVVR